MSGKGGLKEPLRLRQALSGGRVNMLWMYKEAGDGEQINYFDFTSLYPFVNMYKYFLIGAPEIIRSNFKMDIKEYFGLIKCTILPPRGLYLPVLGSKVKMGTDTKLIFTLCTTCTKQKLDVACCNHTDQECVLKHQSYYTPELFKALEKGYKVLDVDEV